MRAVVDQFIICDTGVLSRVVSKRPLISAAYQELVANNNTVVISPTIYIELTHWLIGERGRVGSQMSKAEFARNRNDLNKLPLLNHPSIADAAVEVAKAFPDTGLGDCFTIGAGLVFDVPIFTLNPKHFRRVKGVQLYMPDNYQTLLRNT